MTFIKHSCNNIIKRFSLKRRRKPGFDPCQNWEWEPWSCSV